MDVLGGQIDEFLSAPAYAVVGVSDRKHKYGYKCYACYLNHNRVAYPVNPRLKEIDNHPCYPDLQSLPEPVQSISIITPPAITEKIVQDAIDCGVKNIWMQPGAESRVAVDNARQHGLNVIYGGPCLLVVLGYRG